MIGQRICIGGGRGGLRSAFHRSAVACLLHSADNGFIHGGTIHPHGVG